MESKKDLTSYLNNISILLLSILLIGFPILVTEITTDFFTLPKQTLLAAVVLISLVIFVLKMLIERAVRLRRTIFDLPIILFCLSVFLSAIFAVNRFDSLIAFVPFFFALLAFFIIVNVVRSKNSVLLLTLTFLLSGVVLSTISILSFFKIYLLPFAITQTQAFTPLGSLLDQAVFLVLLLPIALHFVLSHQPQESPTANPSLEAKKSPRTLKSLGFAVISIILLIGFLLTAYQLFNPAPSGAGQRLTILPFETGFQTAFAAISQDSQRLIKGFFFGSGFGTYLTDFTRFKPISFNQNEALWGLTFVRSSSFVLELLATTGVLGLLSFAFLTIRITKKIMVRSKEGNPISIALVLAIIALFVLPVGVTIQIIFFLLIGLFVVWKGLSTQQHKSLFDIELQLVAFKRGLFSVGTFTSSAFGSQVSDQPETDAGASRILPFVFGIIVLIVGGTLGYFSLRYVMSDLEFQESLIATSKNEGSQTYQKQARAISTFPYRDGYYRVFSQTNLALANSLAANQPKGATPSAETQRTIYTLIQQSINAGRAATTIAPQTSLNWQNLSLIYRSIIGFGRNAENFAIVTQQQTIILDPNNPQGYIALGGIYYQLGLWDNAQNQFQIAVNLKPDFANGHYNLGHALENKGDLNNTLREFQIVKRLVVNDKNSLMQITREIEALEKKIEGKESPQISTTPPSTLPPLNLSTPSAQLPPQNPPVKIPSPEVATESSR